MRTLPLLVLTTVLFSTSSVAHSEREWRFRVYLDDTEIGSHVFRIKESGNERRVESDARFSIRLLLIEAYRYSHRAEEHWSGDCLREIDSRTDDNGEMLTVHGTQRPARFELLTPDQAQYASGCIMSFAYWNPVMLRQGHLLNAQTGELQSVRIEALGAETIPVRGQPVATRRYGVHGPDFRIDLWYAANNQWVQLESRTGGRLLRYRMH